MGRAIVLLSPTPHKAVINLPIITFETTAKSLDLQGRDTLIFTSKQAVKSAYAIDPSITHYPALSIGSATTQTLLSLRVEVIHSAQKFYGEALAEDIRQLFSDKKLLYLRPQKVSSDLLALLQPYSIDLKEQIIYQTQCISYSSKDQPPPNAIIIFTSPSTIKCFLKSFKWDSSYTAVIIGEATRKHLPKEAQYLVADQPLIQACIDKAVELQ